MGFFSDFGDGFVGAFKSAGDIVKPVFNEGVSDFNGIYGWGKNFVNRAGRVADNAGTAAENISGALAGLLSNNWFILAGLGIGAYVVIKLVNKD